MRASTILAIGCLLAVLAAFLYLVLERPSREPGQGLRSPMDAETTADHSGLITALNRVSDETRDLRLQMTEFSRLLRSLEGSAASRTIAAGQDAATGESLGASPVERQGTSVAILRTRVSELPDAEKRKRFDELAGQSQEQQTNRARAHWFMTYGDVLDRYGSPDWRLPGREWLGIDGLPPHVAAPRASRSATAWLSGSKRL